MIAAVLLVRIVLAILIDLRDLNGLMKLRNVIMQMSVA